MKIVILTQYFHPEISAPSNRLLELARFLKKLNWDVTVVCAMPNYPKGEIFSEYKNKFRFEEYFEGIRILRYWMYASISPKSIPRIISMLTFSFTSLFSDGYLKKIKPDFIFAESPPLTLAYSGYLLSKISSSKMIMNVSDIWPLTAKELGSIGDGKLYRQIEKIERYLYKKSALCSGQSEEIVAHIKNSGGKNVYLFRNGVDVSRFKKKEPDEQANGNLKIVYTGLLGVAQGVFDIVKNINFRELGSEMHIYGEGAEKSEIANYLSSNKDNNIFLHNTVSRDEIPAVLLNHDCTIIPLVKNIYGAVPSKIYEAMAAGLPVLYSGAGEGAKIIESNRAGLVSQPKDFNKLKENIMRLSSSVELRKEFSAGGRKAAEEKFNRSRILKEFTGKLESMKI